ncbi:MAG: hypothetical protein KKH32_12795, partial [Bacteroidetes bacterium]|nr:hypothetical protein [Bacteroidota bacterium]
MINSVDWCGGWSLQKYEEERIINMSVDYIQTENFHSAYYNSPIGMIKITGSENGIRSVDFVDEQAPKDSQSHPILDE